MALKILIEEKKVGKPMANEEIIKAWKDEDADESKVTPENPIGDIELTDEDLDEVSGGLAGSSCGWDSCRASLDARYSI